jgi:2-hydroxymuconate-semialdehyde hydrolase
MDKPTLLLGGAQDEVLPSKLLQRFQSDIPHAETYVFDKCGHWVHLEQAEGCADAILSFSRSRHGAVGADEQLSVHAGTV